MKIKLRTFKIYQVGTGGTGSQLLNNMCRFISTMRKRGIKISLTLIDGDRFEEKNLLNQNITRRDIGINKAEVLATRYSAIYGIPIKYVDKYIYAAGELMEVVKHYDQFSSETPIIIGAVDNNATRQLMNQVFNGLSSCIYLDSGNGTDNMEGQCVIGYRYNKKTILEPIAAIYPEVLEDNDLIENIVGCDRPDEDESPQHITTNVLAANILFCNLCSIIERNEIQNHVIRFNSLTQSVRVTKA
jgi:hypothetical protein